MLAVEGASMEVVLKKLNEWGRDGKFCARGNRYALPNFHDIVFLWAAAPVFCLPQSTVATVNVTEPGMHAFFRLP